MKKYQVKIRDVVIEIEQADDGKFIMPKFIRNYQSYGTQLKPAYEPVIVARKPVEKSIIDNVMKYGVGGINIDECKIGNEKLEGGTMPKMSGGELGVCNFKTIGADRVEREDSIGRFPANVIHDGSEEAISGFPNTNSNYNDNGKHD